MIALACALSWELDKILPRFADDADSWDPLACAMVRRMIKDDESAAMRRSVSNGRIFVTGHGGVS